MNVLVGDLNVVIQLVIKNCCFISLNVSFIFLFAFLRFFFLLYKNIYIYYFTTLKPITTLCFTLLVIQNINLELKNSIVNFFFLFLVVSMHIQKKIKQVPFIHLSLLNGLNSKLINHQKMFLMRKKNLSM